MKKIEFKSLIMFVLRKVAWVARLAVIPYLFVFLFLSLIIDHDKMCTRTLNHLMPDFGYLSDITKDPEKLQVEKLDKYKRYYEKVVAYTPENASGLSMLGFCYYNMGRQKEALSLYERAAKLHPMFFWFHYNLGVAYFNEGRYSQATDSFMKAINSRWEVTLAYMHSSVTYQRIISSDLKHYSYALTRSLNEAYYRACALTVISYYHLEEFPAVLHNATYAIEKNLGDKRIFHYYGGIAAYKLGWYAQAINLLQKYVYSGHKDISSDAFLYLGLSLEAIGQKGRANVFLKQAEAAKGTKDPSISIEDKVTVQIF